MQRLAWRRSEMRAAACAAGQGIGLGVPDESSSSAEFSGRLGHERVGHEHARKPGVTVLSGGDSAQDRAAVILTPDQRVRAAGPGEPGGGELPAGTLTFLLSDIEGSSRLWESEPEAMEVALQQHDRLLAAVIESHGGAVVTSRGEGDSFFAVFQSAVSAVEAAGACTLRLGREAWPTGTPLRVRMGLHTGEVRVRGGDHLDYTPINRCARVRAAGHGGQVLLTKATGDLVRGRLGGGLGLKKLGQFRLRDLAEPELIFQLIHADLPADFPPIHTVAERTGNLPLQVSSFIGRARELEQTTTALEGARLVTLTGPGGVGKTRLALQVAGQVSPRFRDGAWLCELAPVRDVAGVDDAAAAVFSVTAPAGLSTRRRWWSSSAANSCCWCWITVSICWKQRPRWPGPCSGHVSGW